MQTADVESRQQRADSREQTVVHTLIGVVTLVDEDERELADRVDLVFVRGVERIEQQVARHEEDPVRPVGCEHVLERQSVHRRLAADELYLSEGDVSPKE